MPRFAANISTLFQDLPFLDRIDAAAMAGFKAVECTYPYAVPAPEIAARLRARGLSLELLNLPVATEMGKGERGFAALPGYEAQFAQALETALGYAEILGCPRMHAQAGIIPPGADLAAMRETYIRNLRMAAGRAAERGKVVLIENLNTIDSPGMFMTRPVEAASVVEAVGHPNLRFQFDLYHCQMMAGNVANQIRAYIGITEHFQLAGVPGRHEPDVGEMNYPYLFDVIDEVGFTGWIGCEYKPEGDTVAGLGWARGRL